MLIHRMVSLRNRRCSRPVCRYVDWLDCHKCFYQTRVRLCFSGSSGPTDLLIGDGVSFTSDGHKLSGLVEVTIVDPERFTIPGEPLPTGNKALILGSTKIPVSLPQDFPPAERGKIAIGEHLHLSIIEDQQVRLNETITILQPMTFTRVITALWVFEPKPPIILSPIRW